METRKLGSTEITVSRVAFGAWAVGGAHWGKTDDEVSTAAIHRALDLGITLFDTAPVYGYGHSEELVGRALGARRKDVVLATKCGIAWDPDNPGEPRHDARALSVREECEKSLRRLGTEWIDLYQVHVVDEATPIADTVGALEELRGAGKIRAWGLCNHWPELALAALAAGPCVSLQSRYNLFAREAEREEIALCREKGLGFLAYEPLMRGLLAGKFGRTTRFAADDLRSRDDRFRGERFVRALLVVEQLRTLARARKSTPAQLAIAWVLGHPGVTAALCGAKTAAQVEENAGAAELVLSAEERARIDRAVLLMGPR